MNALTKPRRGYAEGPYGQIHYQQLGEGKPILLLHQTPMTSFQFDNVYAPLAACGLRPIGMDMPGFGLSDPVGGVPTISDFAQAVPALLDTLGIATTTILGHHTGALVANEVAVQFPDRVNAVIFNGPLILTEADRQHFLETDHVWEKAFRALPHAAHMTKLFDIRAGLAAGSVGLERISDYIVHTLLGRGPLWHGHYAAFQYWQDERLPLVRQPGMILTNTGDIIYHQALKAHALRPDFVFTALEGGCVDIVDQQPEAWADAVAAFLERLT
jgi:pimeloyl-ACP methyl ester carboxylesterase